MKRKERLITLLILLLAACAFAGIRFFGQKGETIAVKDDGGQVGTIIDRSHCQLAKAPQSFYLGDLLAAHQKMVDEGITDCIDTAYLMQHNGFSDEQVAQAIRAINGDKKPLNSKQKWAAVYWCLRWYCNFPKNTKEFCDRIDKLPLGELEYECDYNNIRRICSLSFMNEDARHLDKISPSRSETDAYMQCREVVVALAAELGRAALPQVQI